MPINYFAVFISSIIYFIIGSLWYSVFFGSMWVDELKKHNVFIRPPTQQKLIKSMVLTFIINLITCFAMAYLINITNSTSAVSGLIIGSIVAGGFAATTLGSVFTWESRSFKLFLLDSGYPVLGIITAAVILSLWH